MNTTAFSLGTYVAACAIAVVTTAYAADATDARANAKREYAMEIAKCKQVGGPELKQCRKDAKAARDKALRDTAAPTRASPDLAGAAIPSFAGNAVR